MDAEKISWTRDGYLLIWESTSSRMALIRAQEKESRTLLTAAQQNFVSTLRIQCANAEDLELLCLENRLLYRILDCLLPYSPASPPPASSPA